MTIIKDIFEKDIDRAINPVIKVADQDDENLIFQELDEYVVTNEIHLNLGKLYKGITEGVRSKTDSVGVWITGDFGSGKSHFLKIVSFLLKNKPILGKPSIEYLKNKVEVDTFQLLQSLGKKRIDTVLFDIDAEAKEGRDSDDLVQTYLLVFNRMLGLSTNPSVANMERHLIDEGKYEDFKSKFFELFGKNWNDIRRQPTFYKDKIAKALFESGCFNEEVSKEVAQKSTERFEISAEDFSEMIKEHCKKQGPDYMIVFLVDEIGQFISGNRQRILKLQTITEHLGIKCKGQAWNIVTSQEDVEAVVNEFKDMDFSKIQGRFSTRIKMSSRDVKEVIEKRILEKKKDVALELKAYYEENDAAIYNKLNFDNSMSIPLYRNANEFSETYPFIPYQYNMLQVMLTELRNKSKAGKNISSAERSMLKNFKDTVVHYEGFGLKTVIPLYAFYESLKDDLDSPTTRVFDNAERNEKLQMPFDLNVLKTLYLVKYYEGLKTNLTNISALMVSSFDQNRIDLKKDIEASLERLESQNLVQRSGECYIFLTNEEQEVSQAIKRESVDNSKRIQTISSVAFGSIFNIGSKYKYDANHQFAFNPYVDGENINNTSYEIDIRINTPVRKSDPASLAMESQNGVIFDLMPSDKRVIEQFTEYLATQSYIRKCDTSELSSSKKIIIAAKENEIREMQDRASEMLKTALQNAKIYVNGSEMDIPETSPEKRLETAMKNLIDSIYHKMDLMRTPKNMKDIETVFRNAALGTFEEATGSVRLAFDEVQKYLQQLSANHTTIRIRNVVEKFTKRPYGFNDYDVEWILAILFRHNKISLTYDGARYEGRTVSPALGIQLLTKSKDFDKIVIEVHESVSQDSLFRANNICSELFNKVCNPDENTLVETINKAAKDKLSEIDGYLGVISSNPRYPGKNKLMALKELINNLATKSSPYLFTYIDENEEKLREFNSVYGNLSGFYAPDSARKALFDKGLKTIAAYDADELYYSGEITDIRNSIDAILSSEDLKDLPQLNTLCKRADELMAAKLETAKTVELDKLNQFYENNKAEFVDYPDLAQEFDSSFESLVKRLKDETSINRVLSISNGYSIIHDQVAGKIPAPVPPSTPIPGATPATPGGGMPIPEPTRGILYAQACCAKSTPIESEEDVDRYLDNLRSKMIEKLKNGSYDIKW